MKNIPQWPKYSINEDGTIVLNTLTGRTVKCSIQLIKSKESGYYYCTLLLQPYYWRRIAVHRLVALTYLPEPGPNQIWVNHKDGNKTNNHYTNLEWTTISENIQHSYDVLKRKVKTGKDHWNYGVKMSKKRRMLMSEAKKGDKHPKFSGYYYVYFKRYGSAAEASKKTGINAKQIYRKCKFGSDINFYFQPINEN